MSRNALVTGAARGIGRAIAIRLAEDGLDVAINDLDVMSHELEETKQEIEKLGRRSCIIIADVSNDKQVEDMMRTVVKELGSLDVVVANAGIAQAKPFIELTTEDWDKMLSVNLRGVFLCYREAAKVMIEQGKGGKIIGACSGVAHRTFPLMSHYIASKWGVRGLTQAAAMELGKYNITVNAYCPGVVDTPMMSSQSEVFAQLQNTTKEEVMKNFAQISALGRICVPRDIANFVSFLAGTDSTNMTGQSILVDGGIAFS